MGRCRGHSGVLLGQGREQLLRVTDSGDLGEDSLHAPVRSDDDGAADHADGRLTVTYARSPGTVVLGDAMFGIHQEREGEGILGLERRLRLYRVRAAAEDDDGLLLELCEIITDFVGFKSSASGVGARVEVQHHPLPP